jgi:DNA-binding transcriptional LysR family regulator
MVRAGLGITIVPARPVDHAGDAEMLVGEIDEPWAVRRIHAAVHHDRSVSPTARIFLAALVEAVPAEG